jgi:pimeloyl-ACP methyl ester carboxylesterase
MARFQTMNSPRLSNGQRGIEFVGRKPLHVKRSGKTGGLPAVFIHGLGGTMDYWTPLLTMLKPKSYDCLLFNLEGHGLSPTNPLSKISIASLAADVEALSSRSGFLDITLVAHYFGCLVALKRAQDNPRSITSLILAGTSPNHLTVAEKQKLYAQAALVRAEGMGAVVDDVSTAGTSDTTKSSNPVALSVIRTSLLAQPSEGYAKIYIALAEAPTLHLSSIKARTLIMTGTEGRVSIPQVCEEYGQKLPNVQHVEVLKDVGHWHVFEDPAGVTQALNDFL